VCVCVCVCVWQCVCKVPDICRVLCIMCIQSPYHCQHTRLSMSTGPHNYRGNGCNKREAAFDVLVESHVKGEGIATTTQWICDCVSKGALALVSQGRHYDMEALQRLSTIRTPRVNLLFNDEVQANCHQQVPVDAEVATKCIIKALRRTIFVPMTWNNDTSFFGLIRIKRRDQRLFSGFFFYWHSCTWALWATHQICTDHTCGLWNFVLHRMLSLYVTVSLWQ
jgi:hypothetical protein